MNILYIGSSGALSLVPFKELLKENYTIAAVGIYKPVIFKNKVIAIENESLALAANQCDIPIIDLSQSIDITLKQCEHFSIDIILMSCYSKRLPDVLINCVNGRCFNMHPSLLPQYRGPEPIFWQFKEAADLGVSWHRVVHEFDAGEVLIQKKIIVDEGISYADVNQQIASTGAGLLMRLLPLESTLELPTDVPSNVIHNHYYPYPQPQDFTIENSWSAQHAYNFMRATQIFSLPYLYMDAYYQYSLKEALDYDNNTDIDVVEVYKNRLYIPFKEGVLTASYTDKMVI